MIDVNNIFLNSKAFIPKGAQRYPIDKDRIGVDLVAEVIIGITGVFEDSEDGIYQARLALVEEIVRSVMPDISEDLHQLKAKVREIPSFEVSEAIESIIESIKEKIDLPRVTPKKSD